LTIVLAVTAAFAVSALAARVLLWCLSRLRSRAGGGLGCQFGLKGVAGRSGLTLVHLCPLALGLMLLLLLGILRGDLLHSWQQSLPPDAPNTVLIEIQPEQRGPVSDMVVQVGLPRPDLHPLVRARLVSIDGRPVHRDDYTDERAQRLAD